MTVLKELNQLYSRFQGSASQGALSILKIFMEFFGIMGKITFFIHIFTEIWKMSSDL